MPTKLETLLPARKRDFVLRHLESALQGHGMVIEVGVYKGGMLKLIAEAAPSRLVVGFDTFDGLPEPCALDLLTTKPLKRGDFKSTDMAAMLAVLPSNVSLVKGIYPNTATDMPVCFAHLDVDLYEGTLNGLMHLDTVLAQGGTVVVDDYCWHQTPGVRKAVSFFLEMTPNQYEVIASAVYQVALTKKGKRDA